MANYSLISNAVFQPFTYQELAAPLDRTELAHDQLEEQYDLLSEKADMLARLEDSLIDKDSPMTQQYRNYRNSILDEVNLLNSKGLNPASKSRWHDLRRRYNKEIFPIQQMWSKREEEVKMQDAAVNADPSLVFTRDARQSPLQFYKDNPMGGYKAYSGKMFAEVVSKVAKNLKEVAKHGKDGNYVRLSHISPELYELVVENGYTPEQIDNWRNDPVLSGIMSSALSSMGITPENLGGEYDRIRDKMVSWGELALTDAIGKPSISTQKDERFMAGLAHAYKIAEDNNKARNDAAAAAQSFRYSMALKQEDGRQQRLTQAQAARLSGGKRGSGSGEDAPLVDPFPLEEQYTTLVSADKGQEKKLNNAASKLGLDSSSSPKKQTVHVKQPSVYSSTTSAGAPLLVWDSQKSPEEAVKYNQGVAKSFQRSPGYKLLSAEDKKRVDDVASGKVKVGNTRETINADVWNPKTKKLYSKKEFMRQGRTSEEVVALGRTYDNQVTPSVRAIGAKPGQSYDKVRKQYKDAAAETASKKVPAVNLGLPNMDDYKSYSQAMAYDVKGYDGVNHTVTKGTPSYFNNYISNKYNVSNASIVKDGNSYGFMFEVSPNVDNTKEKAKPKQIFVPFFDKKGTKIGITYLKRAEFYQKALKAYTDEGEAAYRKIFDDLYKDPQRGYIYRQEFPMLSPNLLERAIEENNKIALSEILLSTGRQYKVNPWDINKQGKDLP